MESDRRMARRFEAAADCGHIGCDRESDRVCGETRRWRLTLDEQLELDAVVERGGAHRDQFQVLAIGRVGITNPLEIVVGGDPVEEQRQCVMRRRARRPLAPSVMGFGGGGPGV